MWNNKLHATRKYLGGWARHFSGLLRNEKLRLSSLIDELKAIAVVRPLFMQEIELKIQYNAQLNGSPNRRRGAKIVSEV
jgi:hypothetical protein